MSEVRSDRPLRVGFNARLLFDPKIRGWNRYTMNLLAELPEQGVELVLYSDRPVDHAYLDRLPERSYSLRCQGGMRLPAWEHSWLPRQLKADGVDLLHSPFNFGLPWLCPVPRVLTLHDAIDLIFHGHQARWREKFSRAHLQARLYHWIARTRAERIITVSEHARGDITNHLGVPASKVQVIHEAADPLFQKPVTPDDRQRVRSRHALPDRYFFYVGGWETRKNIPFLVRAFAAARLEGVSLVLAGGRVEQQADLKALASELGVGKALHLLGWVEDEDLPALYDAAIAFTYPSLYEGFGLQICEAMARGCPPLVARATCLPEVLGNGGETFGLDDPSELATLLQRVATVPSYRDQLSQRAITRSADFSWRKTAEKTVQVYRELVNRNVHPNAHREPG